MLKLFLTAFLLIFSATTSLALSPEYEINRYPAWIKNQCLELTATKSRISNSYNWDEALACAERSLEKYQRERFLESQIEANNAQAELDRQLTKEIKSR